MLWRMRAPMWLHFDKIASTIATGCNLQSQLQVM